ncbi:MAG: hypothetical protein DRJ64_01825 [Thermoprotei archaeon]|nr:MAG: hypothetical protein DRJ64_01825 [Thermoprotei archaeon]
MQERKASYPSTRILNLALDLYAAAYNSIKTYARYPMWIISDLLSTPLWLIMIMLPIMLFLPKNEWSNPDVYRQFYWGMIFWQVVSMALWSIGFTIRREQQMGTIEPLFLTNANRIVMFAGRLVIASMDLALSMVYLTAVMSAFFNVNITVKSPILLLFSLILSMLMSLGIGALYGSLVIKLKEASALSNILQFILIGFSGVFFTVTKLPENLRIISYIIPYTYCIDLVRHAAIGSQTLLEPSIELLLVAILTALFLIFGYIVLIKIEENTKKTGRIGTY